ncbi:MAG: hypothetical protein KC493_09415 [Bacteriovoracaceae bacterium]|nr:hypothetical protein [Bacteriovoracaceae bacterium]
MAEKKDEKKKDLFKIIYIGDDNSYWSTIQSRIIQRFQSKEFEFHKFESKDFPNYQHLFIDILNLQPQIIYLDFSTSLTEGLKLGHMIKRENGMKSVPVVGLVEKKENVKDGIFAGVEFIHVKCGEYHDVIYDPFALALPKDAGKPEFAEAKFTRDAKLFSDFRVSFITSTFIHLEGNIRLAKDEIITIYSDIPEKMIPSRKFVVKDIREFDLYYDYKFGYDLQFIYVDEPVFDDAELEEKLEGLDENQRVLLIKNTKAKRQQEVNDYKSRLKKTKKDVESWVADNMDRVKPKKTKILIIDKKLAFLKTNAELLDSYKFVIRTQTCLSDDLRDIKISRPAIISFQFFDSMTLENTVNEKFEKGVGDDGTPLSEEEIFVKKEEYRKELIDAEESAALDQLSLVIKTIKGLDGYKPFIILFNCHSYTSQSIQESFKYPFVIVNKLSIDIETIINMATMLEQRNDKKFEDHIVAKVQQLKKSDPNKYRALSVNDFIEKKYYVSAKDVMSKASVSIPIDLKTMTESECTFMTKEELDIGTYRMDFPVDLSLRLVPVEGKPFESTSEGNIYKALIHSVGEDDKKKVRQFVNEIFFAGINEERANELEAFKDLNEAERMKRIQEMEEEAAAESESEEGSTGEASTSNNESDSSESSVDGTVNETEDN